MSPCLRRVLAVLVMLVVGGTAVAVQAQRPGRSWLSRIRVLPGEHERSHPAVKNAFVDVVRDAHRSTVRILSDGTQVALGTVIRADGYIITKASELQGDLECWFADGRRLPARQVGQQPEYDLALLRVAASDLYVAKWSDVTPPDPGSWLVSAGPTEQPASIGIVSAAARALPKPQAVLGVGLEQFGTQPRVNRIIHGSAAAKAGMRVGDIVVSVNGEAMDRPQAVSGLVSRLQPGDEVTLSVQRGQETLTISAVLGDASRIGNFEQAELMDTLGGPLSRRRSGFPYVLEHDTVLAPQDCGGPVVDLEGRIIGINIARVSRVSSYALPAARLRPVLAELLAGQPANAVEHFQVDVAGE